MPSSGRYRQQYLLKVRPAGRQMPRQHLAATRRRARAPSPRGDQIRSRRAVGAAEKPPPPSISPRTTRETQRRGAPGTSLSVQESPLNLTRESRVVPPTAPRPEARPAGPENACPRRSSYSGERRDDSRPLAVRQAGYRLHDAEPLVLLAHTLCLTCAMCKP